MKDFLFKKSKEISYLLRHNPDGLNMDKSGWVSVNDLLRKIGISMEDLEEIVSTNNKKRFGFDETKKRIRAHQGHSKSLDLDIQFQKIKNPKIYYHGTTWERAEMILRTGLKPQSRAYVHLSKDTYTAINVGNRHIKNGSSVVVLEIDGWKMKEDGLSLWESENGVILSKEIPPKYLKKI
jgi:putative RNA 2'-phosphotransferase